MDSISTLLSQITTIAASNLATFDAQANASTTIPNGTTSDTSIFTTAFNLWSFLITSPAIRDGAKLFILGGAIESARRLLTWAWSSFIESFFLTAEFEDRDESFSEGKSVLFLSLDR